MNKYAGCIASARSQERLHMEILWTMMNVIEFIDKLDNSVEMELQIGNFFKRTGDEFFRQAEHL